MTVLKDTAQSANISAMLAGEILSWGRGHGWDVGRKRGCDRCRESSEVYSDVPC
jgi:hypothetical protein